VEEGESLVWHFTPSQRRIRITLPEKLGGGTQELHLEGTYAFTGKFPSF
jgi:hypothetical protein